MNPWKKNQKFLRLLEMINLIKQKKSFLCVGLDPIPKLIGNQTPLNFCYSIINSTIDYAIAYNMSAHRHIQGQKYHT